MVEWVGQRNYHVASISKLLAAGADEFAVGLEEASFDYARENLARAIASWAGQDHPLRTLADLYETTLADTRATEEQCDAVMRRLVTAADALAERVVTIH